MENFEQIIEEIKEKNDIIDIISSYIKVKSTGTNHTAICPFHSEKTPSFTINSQKQFFKCFGCGEAGDVIKFVMKIENIDFIEAIKMLAEKVGINLMEKDVSNKERQNFDKKLKMYDIHLSAARYFFDAISQKSNPGYQYFLKRGLDLKTIKFFGLGYADNTWSGLSDYLLQKEYTQEDIVNSGLSIKRKKGTGFVDRFINRIMFPIFDIRGKVIGFGGRVMDDSLPKYLNSPETQIFSKGMSLYGLNFAKTHIKDETLIIAEGYMDVISLFQYGIKNVVAPLGTAFTKEQANLVKKYAKKVILANDNDEAGIKATIKAHELLSGIDVKILKLGDYKDPDEYIRSLGVDKFKELLSESITIIQFKIDLLKKGYNLHIPEQKLEFTQKIASILREVKSPAQLEYYIEKISKQYALSSTSLNDEVYEKFNNPNKFNKSTQINVEKIVINKSGAHIAEKQLLKVFITNKNLRSIIFLKLDIDDFLLEDSRKILNTIIKSKDMDIITIDNLKNININENFIEDLRNTDITNVDLSVALDDIIKTLRRNSMKLKIDNLLKAQSILEKKLNLDKNINASEVENELLKTGIEIMNIQRLLNNL